LDATSADLEVPDYMKALKENMRGMKVGVPKEFFTEGMDPEVEEAVRVAIEEMKELKAEVQEISLPTTQYAIAAYYLIAPSEASSNLARYDGVRYGFRAAKEKGLLEMYMRTRQEGFGAEVKRRIMLGTYALSVGYYEAYYGKAQSVRTLIKRDFEDAFKAVDVIVTPTMPTPAFKLGEKSHDPLLMYLSDISPFLLTWPVSRPSWCPAASAAKNCRSACRSLDAPLRRRRSSVRPMHMSRPRIGRERGQTLHDHRNRSRHYCARCDRGARIFRAAVDSAS